MTDLEKLNQAATPKPCLFCGEDQIITMPNDKAKSGEEYGISGQDSFYCHCECCGADGPVKDDYYKAIIAWNTRNGELVERDKAVKVKPLIWMQSGNHYAGGYGYVIRKISGEFHVTLRGQNIGYRDTLVEAQLIAQTNHEATIRATLEGESHE